MPANCYYIAGKETLQEEMDRFKAGRIAIQVPSCVFVTRMGPLEFTQVTYLHVHVPVMYKYIVCTSTYSNTIAGYHTPQHGI